MRCLISGPDEGLDYYSVAVVNTEHAFRTGLNINNLRGRKVCFPGKPCSLESFVSARKKVLV